MKTPVPVIDRPGCPFAMPGLSEADIAFYCRLPGGRVRIPTREDRARYCSTGRFGDCPTVQRYTPKH